MVEKEHPHRSVAGLILQAESPLNKWHWYGVELVYLMHDEYSEVQHLHGWAAYVEYPLLKPSMCILDQGEGYTSYVGGFASTEMRLYL